MGFLADPIGSISDTISHVGQVVAESPIAQAVITVGGAAMGIPPVVTAGVLGVNQTAQTGDLGAGLMTGGLSYLGGTGYNNYAATGSVFGAAPTAAGAGSMATSLPTYDPITGQYVNAGAISGAGAGAGGATGATGLMGSLGRYAPLVSNGLNLAGGYLQGQQASDAATTQAQAQIRAAQIAADAAKFRPVGVTTNFGSSRFGYDANGNLTSAGYSLNPILAAQQNQLINTSGGLLNQFTGAQAATAPMSEAAKTAMTLGQGYLTTDPREQAAKYLADQQTLLSAPRAETLAKLRANLSATGRQGLMVGGDAGMAASNPELQAYYNSLTQQDRELAAQATQGGMNYARFGTDMVGTGGDLLSSMYRTQSSAFDPYKTALGGASTIEGLGQQAMDAGINLGAKGTAASTQSGLLLSQGMADAARTMSPANAWSPWAGALSGASAALRPYRFDPMTGKAL